jgi:hypothetical protein
MLVFSLKKIKIIADINKVRETLNWIKETFFSLPKCLSDQNLNIGISSCFVTSLQFEKKSPRASKLFRCLI